MRTYQRSVIFLFLIVTAGGTALASPITAAAVTLKNCGTTTYSGAASAGGSVSTTTCGSTTTGPVLAEGGAGFSSSPELFLNLTSNPGRGVEAFASLDDYLTFHVAGGGSAVVHASISGTFSGAGYDSHITLSLGLGTFFHQYFGSVTDSIDGNPGSDVDFPQTGDPLTGVNGHYTILYDWTVANGGVYEVFRGLRADAANGATLYINDPLTFGLPAGVTFTSASGSTYAAADQTPQAPSTVPEPASLLLLGTGLAAASVRRLRRRGEDAGGLVVSREVGSLLDRATAIRLAARRRPNNTDPASAGRPGATVARREAPPRAAAPA